MGDIYHKGLPDIAQCLLIVLFGILMLIIGFTSLRSAERKKVNFFSLGAFAILTGVWSANDTMILQVFTLHPEMVRLISYSTQADMLEEAEKLSDRRMYMLMN